VAAQQTLNTVRSTPYSVQLYLTSVRSVMNSSNGDVKVQASVNLVLFILIGIARKTR
jgi:hypothetical protein